jgi:acetyl esterase/lipase
MAHSDARTIEIGKNETGSLFADIYLPAKDGPHPVVVGVSGGGWSRGHRRSLKSWGAWLAERGVAVAAIDYRRATGGPAWPGNAEDVATALRHLAQDGAEHGLDPSRMALLGVSAGAHLAATALLSPAFQTPPVKGFVGIYGVYDLLAHWQADTWRNAAEGTDKTVAMIGCTPFHDPLRYHAASPLRQITYDAALPVLLVWGDADREVSPEQSTAFGRALIQARFPVRQVEVPGAGHMWFSEEGPEAPGSHSARIAPDLLRFLTTTLGAGS